MPASHKLLFRIVLALSLVIRSLSADSIDKLMPTPNVYADRGTNPFADVPEHLRTAEVEVLYVTDRKPYAEPGKADVARYGKERSASLAFGSCVVRMGQELSWQELVKASRTGKRSDAVTLSIKTLQELGRLPPTPYVQVSKDNRLVDDPKVMAGDAKATRGLLREVQRQLAETPRKEAFLFVHGVNYTFEESVFVTAELWHFLGREGVPIAYSWPAGGSYSYDRESGEFTVFHFKQLLRMLASFPALEKIHFVAHSRGAAVLLSALRELVIGARAAGKDPGTVYRVGDVVLAAADLDMEVVGQRVGAERVTDVFQRLTVYVSPSDKALGAAERLFASRRVGRMGAEDLTPEEKARVAILDSIHVIHAKVASGFVGHSYFRESPAVSSDLILLLRYGKQPGAESGRPLLEKAVNFWEINDKYMKAPQTPKTP